MNKKEIITLFIGAVLIIIVFSYWLLSGGEVFTKTKIIVERKDELFGTTYKELVNRFILGLDYTLAISGLIILITGILFFKIKKQKKG